MHILHVVGARPNFMKAAPVLSAIQGRNGTRQSLVHTGQHYDANMSDVFFEQLGLPKPDCNLAVGAGSHARQTAEVMVRFEEVVLDRKPDVVVVYGDVNSTVATSIVCAKLGIPVAHVEAGLRSFDRAMPEEINRILTDQLADKLFTPSQDGDANLLREGILPGKIHFVGNVMIDTLIRLLPLAEEHQMPGLPKRYVLVTLHRPSNVDDSSVLKRILSTLIDVTKGAEMVFPVHPRTRQKLGDLGLDLSSFRLVEPVPYLTFVALQKNALAVITDSGGVQEETTYLGVPCITLRENTERPVTITIGTNVLVGHDMEKLRIEADRALAGAAIKRGIPPLWDGRAGDRVAQILS